MLLVETIRVVLSRSRNFRYNAAASVLLVDMFAAPAARKPLDIYGASAPTSSGATGRASCGGASTAVVRQYIEQQQTPH